MPMVAEVKGAHGVQQIGRRKPLLVVSAKGTVTTVANDGSYQQADSIVRIAPPSSTAILAFRPAGPMAQMQGGGGSSYLLAGTAPVGTAVDYWFFDKAANGLLYPGNPLFETRNPDTLELIFSTKLRPFNVKTKLLPNLTASFTGTAGRTYAAVQARLANHVKYLPGGIDSATGQFRADLWTLAGIAGAVMGTAGGLDVVEYEHSREAFGVEVKDPAAEHFIAGGLVVVDVTAF